MMKVFKETREEHRERLDQILLKMREEKNPYQMLMNASRPSSNRYGNFNRKWK